MDATSASLDAPETNAHPLRVQSRPQYRIHAPWLEVRERIVDAMLATEDPELLRRADKLGRCCQSPNVYVARDKFPSLTLGACRDRFCPFCSSSRAKRVRRRVRLILERMNAPRFITLTVRDDDRPLAVRLDELHQAFRRLRSSKAWKARVVGGVFVLEITRNVEAGTWHPHLHVLVDGEYFDWKVLRSAWEQASRGATVIDIRAVHDRAKAALYLTSYLSKSLDTRRWTPPVLLDYAKAVRSRRFVGTFGKSHNVRLDQDESDDRAPRTPHACVSASTLLDYIDQEEEAGVRAARILTKLGGAWRLMFLPLAERGADLDGPFTPQDLDDLTVAMLQICELMEPEPIPTRRVDKRASVDRYQAWLRLVST
jgi:hypothetical protein